MLLELQNLGKSFGEHEVLKDVNAGVERGDRIGIIGANGTGKTTLLRDKCDELDDTRFHQQELYDEWEKLAEEQEAFEAEDA